MPARNLEDIRKDDEIADEYIFFDIIYIYIKIEKRTQRQLSVDSFIPIQQNEQQQQHQQQRQRHQMTSPFLKTTTNNYPTRLPNV